jgi:hypothetical protein
VILCDAGVSGEQLEDGGELSAAADIGDDEWRPIVALGLRNHGRRAEDSIQARLGPADVTDVLERDLVSAAARLPDEPEVGEVVALAREPWTGPQGSTVPQQPLPRQQADHGLPKLTFGTCLASAGA